MRILYFLVAMLSFSFVSGCSNFFGGVVKGPYTYQFGNKVKCAIVEGWDEQPKCYCVLVEKDDRIIGKVFIPMEKKTCK